MLRSRFLFRFEIMTDTKNMNLVRLMEHFETDEKCRDYIEAIRWPEGVVCENCGYDGISEVKGRKILVCNSCHHQFSVTAGTVFHRSHIPLKKWFIAVLLMCQGKKGISAVQMKNHLGIGYRAAWFLCHRIRSAMADTLPALLDGIVEVDETFVGRAKGRGRSKGKNKSVVVGAVEREGEVRLRLIEDASRKTLHKFIEDVFHDGADEIHTDEWSGYSGVGDEGTIHATVNHSDGEWVSGHVHTNTIENVWSLLKRSIIGSYHKVSKKHLEAYLQELEWRYNNRHNAWLFRDTMKRLVESDPLEYKKLTA